MPALKAFIVEDSPVILENLIATLEEVAQVEVVGSVADEAGAVRWMKRDPNATADLFIVDVFLRSGTGLGVLQAAQQLGLRARRVVLTNYATDEMRRRWQRFGESGAKLICGAEAMAVRPDGRANPNQLIIIEQNKASLAELVGILKRAHAEHFGTTDDLVIGFQLTHSGRFCKPNSN